MRKLTFLSSFLVAGLMSTLASAQSAPASGASAGGGASEKKIGVGGDLLFNLPIGDFADASGPQIGPVLRAGYRVIPNLEVTGRIGYLFGLSKSSTLLNQNLSYSINIIPIWVGGRYFIMDPSAGLYAGAEIGLNLLSAKVSDNNGNSTSQTNSREGFNIGAGYVISKDLPIDVRVQYSLFNLLGKNTGETTLSGIGVSVGYTVQL